MVKFEAEKREKENLKFRTYLRCNADEKELDRQFLGTRSLASSLAISFSSSHIPPFKEKEMVCLIWFS